jgi:hypothetical protein
MTHKKNKLIHNKAFSLVGLVSLAFVLAGTTYLIYNKSQPVGSVEQYQPIKISDKPKIKVDETKPLQYEVLAETKVGQSTRITVYTPEISDSRIIALNDILYVKYKAKSPALFIDYFDDKEVAKIYFATISNPKVSQKDKKKLVSHYKAVMSASQINGNKLFKVANGNIVLKTY